MPKKIDISQEVKDQMCRDYRKGESVRNIAKIYGIGRNKAYEIVHSGCDVRMGRPTTVDNVISQNMVQDYANGLSVKKIAKKYKYYLCSTYRILNRHGIKTPGYHDNTKKNEVIKDLVAGEMTQSQIAKKHGISRQRVFQIKRELDSKNETLAL